MRIEGRRAKLRRREVWHFFRKKSILPVCGAQTHPPHEKQAEDRIIVVTTTATRYSELRSQRGTGSLVAAECVYIQSARGKGVTSTRNPMSRVCSICPSKTILISHMLHSFGNRGMTSSQGHDRRPKCETACMRVAVTAPESRSRATFARRRPPVQQTTAAVATALRLEHRTRDLAHVTPTAVDALP